jgi:hypothetical protein
MTSPRTRRAPSAAGLWLVLSGLVALTLLVLLPIFGFSSPSAADKSALLGTRDVFMCFDNPSGVQVSLKWKNFQRGISSQLGEGTLSKGQKFCAEGSLPMALLSWSDVTTEVTGRNAPLMAAQMFFNYTREDKGDHTDFYGMSGYYEGETLETTILNHHVSTTRLSNNDWVNFIITVLD